MQNNLLILLTKFPESGKVKTRLGKDIGFDKASEIQELFIRNILKNNIGNKNYDLKIGLKGEDNIDKFFINFGIDKKLIFNQIGEDLGTIMNNSIKFGLKEYIRVIIIGSDIPSLDCNNFDSGFEKLIEKDIVIGEANDGGYYLIGMKKENKVLFEDILYSTSTVFDETLEKIKENNLTYGYLDEKIDIDTLDDLLLAEKQDKSGFLTEILQKCEIKK